MNLLWLLLDLTGCSFCKIMILISIPILGISLSLVRGRSFIMILHITLQFSGKSGSSENDLELIVFLVLEFSSTLLLRISNMSLFFSLQIFLCLHKMFFCNSTCVFPTPRSNQIGGMDTIICVNDDELGYFGHVGGDVHE